MGWRIATGVALLAALGAAGCGAWAVEPPAEQVPSRDDRIVRPAAEWKAKLSASEFQILREKGTEWAFTGEYWDHHEDGVYTCAACGLELYDSRAKFDSGTGWPSYFEAVGPDRVDRWEDRSHGMTRVELTCARCGGHLGHVFPDGPKPTGERHCINSASLDFTPRAAPASDKRPKKSDP